MNESTARGVVAAVVASEDLENYRWDLAKDYRNNYSDAAKHLGRSSLIVVLTVLAFELLQLGAVSENAKLGPIEVKQTAEVQLFIPVIAAYFTYTAVCYRCLVNAYLWAHRTVVEYAYPAMHGSNLSEALLPPVVDVEGFKNNLSTRSLPADFNALLGSLIGLAVLVGIVIFQVVAYLQVLGDKPMIVVVVVSILGSLLFDLRALLVLSSHFDVYSFVREHPGTS